MTLSRPCGRGEMNGAYLFIEMNGQRFIESETGSASFGEAGLSMKSLSEAKRLRTLS